MELHLDRTFKYYWLMFKRHDLAAGLTVFLVALPLCLGVALASGAPLYSGILSGIIGGIVVSVISGSQLAVSGPAAGLTTLVSAAIISLGNFETFLLAVMIAGVFQILLGVLKLGVFASYFPSSVIKGMMAAIGIILISKQIPLALGYNQPDFWSSGFIQIFTSKNFLGNIVDFNSHITRGAVFISFISLAILIFLKQPKNKKYNILPASLVVVIFGIVINYLLTYFGSSYALKTNQLVNIPSNIFAELKFPDFTKILSNIEIWKNGLLIGVLATLETLLSIEAMDKLDKHNRITPVNRELMAQGVGNFFCGLLGAIPLTAVVVRGSANIQAGAKTKASSFVHGVFLLLSVLLIPFLINLIPYASLSAILILTGFGLTKIKIYKSLFNLGWKQFVPFIITIVIILATDLLIGVSIGLLISIYYIIKENFKESYDLEKTHYQGIDQYILKLHSNVTFLNKVEIKNTLDKVPPYSSLIIDGTNIHFIDHDVLEIISDFVVKAHDRHIQLELIQIQTVETAASTH